MNASGLPGFFSLPTDVGISEDKIMAVEGDLCQKQLRQMSVALKTCYESPVANNDMGFQIGRVTRGKYFR